MRTALIVDDNSDIRMLIAKALSMRGIAVAQAENGKIAQEIIQNGLNPCLVLLDLMMPVMTGQDFLSWKNNVPTYADIPVILISAQTASVDQYPGTQAAFRKPLDLKQIISKAKELCHDCG